MIININKKKYKYLDKIKEAYDYALKFLKIPCKELEVNLKIVSKGQIRKLNKTFRDNDKVTDVLSFPNLLEYGKKDMQLLGDKLTKDNFIMDINPETNHIMLGDICICSAVVYKQAKEYGNTRDREVVYMAVHGLLHLLGYDHMLEEDKKIMREVEEKIMTKINLGRE